MAILNYTTTIPVEKTVGEIQGILVKHKARSIMIDYDEQGTPIALSFLIPTAHGERGFRLPSNLPATHRVLLRQYNSGKIQRRFTTQEQAARVAWRILKDWLEAQLAIIETEMVTLEQVLLPYMTNEEGKTLYEVMEERRLLLPGPRVRNGGNDAEAGR